MRQRRLRLFCALVTILLATPSCNRIFDTSRPMDLSYAVSVDGPEAQSFEIVLTIGNVTASRVTLASGAQDELLGVETFMSYDVHGNPLAFERTQTESEISIGGYDRSVAFSRFIIDTEDNDVIVVRYASSPDFEDHGDVYGYIGQEFGLVSGYNLFLAPETDNQIGSVDVQFELPDSWEVVTTWTRQDGSYFPGGHQAPKKRQLLDSWFALGEFRRTQTRIRDTEISIFGYKGWEETYHENLVRNAVSLYRYVTDAMDSSPAEDYTMVFLPRSSDGHSVYVRSVAMGQARSMDPATFSDWRFVAEDLARIWVDFEPFKLEFRNPEDRWIIDGFAVYSGIHALSAVQEAYPNKIQEMLDILYTAYGATIRPMSGETWHTHSLSLIPIEFTQPLARVDWSLEPRNSWTRVMKAPTVAYLLDQYIQSVTDGRHTLFDLVRSEYAQFIQTGREADLKAGLETLTGVDAEDFWRKRIENDDFENAPIYLQPAGLDLEPYQLQRTFTNEEIRNLDRDPALRSRSDQVLQLVITAYGESYLETCGCASNQSGGVARRTTAFNQLEALYPDVLKIDLGRAFPRHVTDELSEYETVTYFDSMNLMNYDAIIPSVYELWAKKEFLLKIKDSLEFPFIAANVVDKATNMHLFDPYIIAQYGELRVGIIGLAPSVSDSYRDVWAFESATYQYDLLDPIETASRYVSELKDKCDLIIVAGDIPPLTVRRIIQATEHIDLVVTADGYANVLYPLDAERPSSGYAFVENYGYQDSTLVVNSRIRSYGFHRLDLALDRQDGRIKKWVFLNKELNQSVEDDAHTRDILNTFYASIEKDSAFWSSYDQRFFWALEEQAELNGKNAYAGVDNCESCHREIVEEWRGSLHAQGLNTLIKKHKNFYPRCVSCHTTGFNYETGFKINSSTLGGVQCEVCHGPGENHIKWAETAAYQSDDVVDASFLAGFFGDSEPEIADTHIRSVLDEKYCVECHDQDNSPKFDFVTYWEKIKH